MRLGSMTAALLLVSLIARPAAISAQQPDATAKGTWDAVKAVALGSSLSVKLKSGKKVKGNQISATDTTLTLSLGKNITDVNRDDVSKVYLVVPRRSDKGGMIGGAAGAGFGVALSFAGCECGSPPATAVIIIGLAFAAIGYGLGRLFSPKYKQVLIYDVKR